MTTPFNRAHLEVLADPDGTVRVHYDVPVLTKEKGGYWFVTCPLFKSLGYSAVSLEEAVKDHRLDVDVFLDYHIRAKTLDRALAAMKWEVGADRSRYEVTPDIPSELIPTLRYERQSFKFAA